MADSAPAHASWRLTGLDCPDCARTVDVSVSRVDGVRSASLSFASGVLFVEHDADARPGPEIEGLIAGMGYGIEALDPSGGGHGREFSVTRGRTGEGERTPAVRSHDRATVASGVLIVVGWLLGMWLGESADSYVDLVRAAPYAAAILVGGGLIFRRAVTSVRARVLDMNVLMTVAVAGAALIGEWGEAAAVVFLFSVGGALEARSLERTRDSIRGLMELAPEVAHVVRAAGVEDVRSADVSVGETVEIRPGERVPLDGRVVRGSSAIDQSAITGESVPADRDVGDDVFAGTLNTYGSIRVEVTAPAGDTTLARVTYLVEEAQAQRAPSQRLVDRFTRRYTPIVTGLAAAVAIVPPVVGRLGAGPAGADLSFETWFYRALVLLVVSCPCALVISTPVAIVSAITRATRDGVLIKGGAFLEQAARVRAVAFDKTGTLTTGDPRVAEVVRLDTSTETELLRFAGAIERSSTHPVARAVARETPPGEHAVTDVRETPGRGVTGRVDGVRVAVGSPAFAEELGIAVDGARDRVAGLEARGRTVLFVAVDGRPAGLIGVADTVREGTSSLVAALRDGGVERVTMVTGDNDRVAATVARLAGVDEFESRTLPADKIEHVRRLKERFGVVAMVGDGVNDAPALAAADLGIAMGAAGSDTALETADVALMADDLAALPRFFRLGRRTAANIRQNVAVSVAVKMAVLVLAVLGYAPLWLAVFADTGVALLVIANGLRLLRA